MIDSFRARRFATALALLLLALLAGCGTRSVPLDEMPLPYRQAEDAFRLGNYEKAVRGYQIFLDSEFSDDYEELLPRAYYRLALSEYRRGRYAECLTALDRMERRLPDREWPQVYTLRGDAEQARGKPMSALRWWEQAWQVSTGEEQRAAKQHIADALDRMDQASLDRARGVLTAPPLQALVEARLRGPGGAPPPRSMAGGRPTPRPAPPLAVPPGGPRPDQPVSGTVRIGALLPLSGEFASYGQRSLNGIKLGLGPLAAQLVVRDTRGDAAAARAALDALITDPSVLAVIGPLRSKVSEVVAPRAEGAGLPLVTLSQQDAPTGQWVKQPAMTAGRQASELAEFAIATQGLRRFGIFYPNDPYGVGLSDAFRDEVQKRGGTIVGAVVYDPNQREHSVELLSLAKWISDDGLQAVFIPDFAASAIPLAVQLRKAHPDVALLGSNGWNDPAVLGPAAMDLDGAVFVDGFFASSTRRGTQEFVAAYRGAFGGATPELLEAQGYDAALLVREALQTGARSRMQVAQGLMGPRTVEGAAGRLGVGPHGIQRELFLLQLSGGNINELTPGRAVAAPPRPPADEIPDAGDVAGPL